MKTKVCFLFVLFAIVSITGKAQENPRRFGFEISGGPSMATREILSGKLQNGFGVEGIIHYRLMSFTGVYGGWGWNRFSSNGSFAGNNSDFEETGYVIGLQFKHPIPGFSSSYYLRAGALYNHIEIENEDGMIIYDSGHGFGWQLAGGVDIRLGSNLSFTPGVKYNALNCEVDNEGVTIPIKYHYLSLRAGLSWKF